MEPTALSVFLLALITALATGLGALPLLAKRAADPRWIGLGDAAAAGFMLAASAALVVEGASRDLWRLSAGAAAGLVFIVLARRAVGGREHAHLGALRGADATRAIVIIVVMTVHSFAEGAGVGVAFGGGQTLGVLITAAIALHNIPEGLAISLVLVPRGVRVGTAAAWSIGSSLPQPLVAVPAFLLVESFSSALAVGFGFAAGAMTWMALAELVPAARARVGRADVGRALAASFAAMTLLQLVVLGR